MPASRRPTNTHGQAGDELIQRQLGGGSSAIVHAQRIGAKVLNRGVAVRTARSPPAITSNVPSVLADDAQHRCFQI